MYRNLLTINPFDFRHSSFVILNSSLHLHFKFHLQASEPLYRQRNQTLLEIRIRRHHDF